MNKRIKTEIAEQYNKVYYLEQVATDAYYKLEELIIERSNELFEKITSKVPKIIKIPLYCTYISNEFEISQIHEESISEFENYALDFITDEELNSIKEELEELYYMADTLVYHMYMVGDNDTYDLTYHCITGREVLVDVECLNKCFDNE